METITFTPIGIIHSPFKQPEGTPIQTTAARGVEGRIEIFPEFQEGLKDLDGFSHIILIAYLHRSRKYNLLVKPHLDNRLRGVFSTRSPSRPNPVGLSIVQLIEIKENILIIQDLDFIDGTPLLDIKPYIPTVDIKQVQKIGWLEGKVNRFNNTRDNGRFSIQNS